jgi:hypothetical protein
MLSFCGNKYVQPSALDDLLGVSSTSVDVDPSSASGETEQNAYTQVQQVSTDTDPLVWWKQHKQEFPRLARMPRQYWLYLSLLCLRDSSVVWDLSRLTCGAVFVDTTMIDLMWAKQAP